MGKNKGQKTKMKKEKAFTVISSKKSKTKAVTKNLKKMNFQTKAKTDKANEKFKAIQEAVLDTTKTTKGKTKSTAQMIQTKPQLKNTQDTAIDMEMTTEDFAKL